jgi:hypothetical protein
MNNFCLNTMETSSCAETLDFKSNLGKDCGGPCEIDIKVCLSGIMCRLIKLTHIFLKFRVIHVKCSERLQGNIKYLLATEII